MSPRTNRNPVAKEDTTATITDSIDIARAPDDVFVYVSDVVRHPEWQRELVSVELETDRPIRVGTRSGATRERASEASSRSATSSLSSIRRQRQRMREGNGPVSPRRVSHDSSPRQPTMRVRSMTMQVDFQGRGVGKLFIPLFRRKARTEVHDQLAQPEEQTRKRRLISPPTL